MDLFPDPRNKTLRLEQENVIIDLGDRAHLPAVTFERYLKQETKKNLRPNERARQPAASRRSGRQIVFCMGRSGNRVRHTGLTAMDNNDLQARTEQALVVVALSTATLIACVGLLVSTLQ